MGNSQIFLDKPGVEGVIGKISSAIDGLEEQAKNINDAMTEVEAFWKGNAHDKAQSTYDTEYRQLLTVTIPQEVENFRKFIETCKKAIEDVDNQLSGA